VGAAERLRSREQRARLARLINDRTAQDDALSLLEARVASDREALATARVAIASGAVSGLAAWFDQRVDLAAPAPTSRSSSRVRPSTLRG
jgi:hypothetical protein